MYRLMFLFLMCALAAAFCGFGVIADLSYAAGRLLFYVFLALAVLAFVAGLYEERSFRGGGFTGR